jgi:hypothetical protein
MLFDENAYPDEKIGFHEEQFLHSTATLTEFFGTNFQCDLHLSRAKLRGRIVDRGEVDRK